MIDIPAYRKIATRIRPMAQACVRPTPETVTTHAADCPHCLRETRVSTGREGTIYGSCPHFRGIKETDGGVFRAVRCGSTMTELCPAVSTMFAASNWGQIAK